MAFSSIQACRAQQARRVDITTSTMQAYAKHNHRMHSLVDSRRAVIFNSSTNGSLIGTIFVEPEILLCDELYTQQQICQGIENEESLR